MTPDKPKASNVKNTPAAAKPAPARPAVPVSAPLGKPPPLFRGADWLCFGITTLVMFLAYMYTLSPDLTLEDSGELAVGSYYAGVPHPPGYPFWTVYTWLFTVLLPFSNIAWRVAVSSAVAGALTCGLVGLMVSRGSSMMVEGIGELKGIAKNWENEICVVAGFVSGALIGFDGFMWSQAVIVEVYPLTALSLVGVMIFLFRWLYAPHQHRYLYLAWFTFGIAFNNHQSVVICALSMEVLMICVQPQLGRDLLLGNTILWALGMIGSKIGLVTTLSDNVPVMTIYCLIGAGSGFGFLWLWIRTKKILTGMHWALICCFAFMVGALFYLYMPITSMTNPPLNWGYPRTVTGFWHAFTRGQYERIHPTTGTGTGIELIWTFCARYAGQIKMLAIGSLDELNLVYILMAVVPFLFFKRLQARERAWLIGLAAFWVVMGPFLMMLFNPAPDRQSLSLVRVFFTPSHMFLAMGTGYGLTLLLSLLATAYAQHRAKALVVAAVATGIALYAMVLKFDETAYIVPRAAGVLGVALAGATVLLLLVARERAPVGALLAVFALMPGHPVLNHWSDNEQRGHRFGFYFGHDMFTPPFQGPDGQLSYDPKLRAQMMKDPAKAKLIYPEMDKDTVLFGGTDPGRFCPTYMIFCESFIKPQDRYNTNFDRRDVYIITQNALADGTYLNYIRGHYFRSAQIDPPFFSEFMRSERERSVNYKTNLLARLVSPLDDLFLGNGDRVEKRRRAGSSFFKESDFTDLAGFAKKLSAGSGPAALSKYLRDQLSPETQALLGGPADARLGKALARDLNRLLDGEYEANQRLPGLREELGALTNELALLEKPDSRQARKKQKRIEAVQKEIAAALKIVPFYETNRFADVKLSEYVRRFIAEKPQLHSRIRLSRLLLEEAYPREIATSLGGVYPDREIYTPSNEDSQKCFADYMADAQERMKKGQLRPGEDVRTVGEGAQQRVQVSGQVAVMAINALLTKVIFERNPGNEFYVEESFPLDWMYPHLTPYGIIMKINRQPIPELTQEMVDRDHHFWSTYSERLIGNWITYDTPISNICAFAEKTYVLHDYRGFKGDPRFVRDDDGQKAFSKLRSSIGGVYAWRIDNAKNEGERARAMKEAEFAFKQAYAFCPYSPEALYRFVNILIRNGRIDDAHIMARTSKKLDPENSQLDRLIEELDRIKKQQRAILEGQGPANVTQLEAEFRAHPNNVTNAVQLAQSYAQLGRRDQVVQIADSLLTNAPRDPAGLSFIAQVYSQLFDTLSPERVRQVAETLLTNATNDPSAVYFTVQAYSRQSDPLKLETVLMRWARLNPTPEAWLDLAAVQAALNKTPQAMASVKTCLELNSRRLAATPQASNVTAFVRTDARLKALQALPEFQQMLATNK